MDSFNKVDVAVCGLHMTGFSLNSQLTDLDAEYVSTTVTAPQYKLYALNTVPEKPGLVKVNEHGSSIEVEIWAMSHEALGKFLTMIPSPLGLGKLSLINGLEVIGFICEPIALDDAKDISTFGGYRNYCLSK